MRIPFLAEFRRRHVWTAMLTGLVPLTPSIATSQRISEVPRQSYANQPEYVLPKLPDIPVTRLPTRQVQTPQTLQPRRQPMRTPHMRSALPAPNEVERATIQPSRNQESSWPASVSPRPINRQRTSPRAPETRPVRSPRREARAMPILPRVRTASNVQSVPANQLPSIMGKVPTQSIVTNSNHEAPIHLAAYQRPSRRGFRRRGNALGSAVGMTPLVSSAQPMYGSPSPMAPTAVPTTSTCGQPGCNQSCCGGVEELGSSLQNFHELQIQSGRVAQMVMYHYDFGIDERSGQLNAAGMRKLIRLAKYVGATDIPLVIEAVPGRPDIGETRRASVQNALASNNHTVEFASVPIVIRDVSQYGIVGSEADVIHQSRLQTLQTRGERFSGSGGSGGSNRGGSAFGGTNQNSR